MKNWFHLTLGIVTTEANIALKGSHSLQLKKIKINYNIVGKGLVTAGQAPGKRRARAGQAKGMLWGAQGKHRASAGQAKGMLWGAQVKRLARAGQAPGKGRASS
jgi:hypothetical protein